MGLLLSVVISYAGVRDALDCINHILSGMLPDTDPDFQDLIQHYTKLLQKSADSSASDWTRGCGQGYLCLTEDQDGKLKSAAVKYYDGQPDSTAILFSTKISSFGQESVEDNSQSNGDYRTERYTPTTKTIQSNTSESFSVGNRRSPTSEHISDPPLLEDSFVREERDTEAESEDADKVTWHYRPKSPIQSPLPEIHFQLPFDDQSRGVDVNSEEFLRSLDGIKYRPLQRNDPSGRRRSFKKRHSSSSNSSRESRASREEELKMFTSLEENELQSTNQEKSGFGSSPNLVARSNSRSQSRDSSRERKKDWSMEGSVDSVPEDITETKPLLKDIPKLGSFEEEKEAEKVTEEEEEDIDDFWGNSGD